MLKCSYLCSLKKRVVTTEKIMLYIVILILFVLVPDIYIWWQFVRENPIGLNILYWMPTAALFAALAVAMSGHYVEALMKPFFVLMLCFAMPKLLFAICSLAGKGLGTFIPAAFTVGNIVGLAVAAIVLCGAVYGFTIGWKRMEVKEISIAFAELPDAFDGYTIVQLSDLHIGTYTSSPEVVRKLVNTVNAIKPDAILFTGDLVNTSPKELDIFMDVLSRLKAADGVYSILGNHDYCTYRRYDTPDGQRKNLAEVKRRERELGWHLLLNEHHVIHRGTDSIAILGVENDGKPPFPALADLPKAIKGLPKDVFKVLMSHDPTHWRRAILPETDIPLTLSGHTHAMQLKIGNFSPSQWQYPEWGGIYTEGNRTLHVSTGTGSNVPFRLGAWPEIDVIRLTLSSSLCKGGLCWTAKRKKF